MEVGELMKPWTESFLTLFQPLDNGELRDDEKSSISTKKFTFSQALSFYLKEADSIDFWLSSKAQSIYINV